MGLIINNEEKYNNNINGISITVKKNANILRIWLKENELADIKNYNFFVSKYSSILYKKHFN